MAEEMVCTHCGRAPDDSNGYYPKCVHPEHMPEQHGCGTTDVIPLGEWEQNVLRVTRVASPLAYSEILRLRRLLASAPVVADAAPPLRPLADETPEK